MDIRVLIADDHWVVREGLKTVLKSLMPHVSIVAEASNGKEVLEYSRAMAVDLYILDISMPVLNGLETTEQLIKRDKGVKVIILSMHDDRASVEKALRYGAKGYLIKESLSEEIVQAIDKVHAGAYFLSPQIAHYIIENFLGSKGDYEKEEKIFCLTGREKEIIRRVAEGLTSKEIAAQLEISVGTVQVHRKNMMKKLNLHKQADLVRFACKEGLARL